MQQHDWDPEGYRGDNNPDPLRIMAWLATAVIVFFIVIAIVIAIFLSSIKPARASHGAYGSRLASTTRVHHFLRDWPCLIDSSGNPFPTPVPKEPFKKGTTGFLYRIQCH